MDQKIKQQWVEALRSGRYRQGKGSLRAEGAYCCLGVLCDVVGEVPIDEDEDFGYDKSLPINVAEMVGLGDVLDPIVTVDDGYNTHLSSLNDDGLPFTKIADLIEAQL